MKDRRRSPRIPVLLEIELRRSRWERHVTEDASRRGIFVRIAGPCPVGQLIQIRICLPRDPEPLEMMAKVARRVAPSIALQQGRMPGIGLEFFCLSNQVLKRWDGFIQDAGRYLDASPGIDAYGLVKLLEQAPPPESAAPTPSSAAAAISGGKAPAGQTAPVRDVDDRANLIFRAQSVERLEKFLDEELVVGKFALRIPYRMTDEAAVNLRVIHPRTQEEFLLSGSIHNETGSDGYLIRFQEAGAGILKSFRRFVVSGMPPELQLTGTG